MNGICGIDWIVISQFRRALPYANERRAFSPKSDEDFKKAESLTSTAWGIALRKKTALGTAPRNMEI